MEWKVAEAKQRLSELLRTAAHEPQTIVSRSRAVAVVVDVGTFEQFKAWQSGQQGKTVAEAFAELRAVAGPGAALGVPRRHNRRDTFRTVRR
jgi:prevent-host-death family protein